MSENFDVHASIDSFREKVSEEWRCRSHNLLEVEDRGSDTDKAEGPTK